MSFHVSHRVAAMLISNFMLCATEAVAGTGRLTSTWMPFAPHIDGILNNDFWDHATRFDVAAGVHVWIGNDARTLYLAVQDEGDFAVSFGDFVYLAFDDEGGSGPVLDDGAWTNPACQSSSELGEGVLFFGAAQTIEYSEWYDNGSNVGFCPNQDETGRAGFAAAASGAGLFYEIAIPLDGPMPLRDVASGRIGIWLRVQRGETGFLGCVPAACGGVEPAGYRNLFLAGLGCNNGPQSFDGGLPIDWTRSFEVGSGDGWVTTTSGGDPAHCDENVTGGAGPSICAATGDQANGGFLTRLEPPPFTLRYPQFAELRFRANFQTLGALAEGFGVDSSLDDGGGWQEELLWEEDHGAPGGPGEQVSVDLSTLTNVNPVRARFGTGSSAGNVNGGFAQIDDVELRCGPEIFFDGFETRLTTHWSATSP